jgi:hypothetical protein
MTDVPKIVVSRLAGPGSQVGRPDSHPDANLLTAFAEQALGDVDRQQVLEHLTQCGECREIVWLAVPPVEAANVVPERVSAPWLSWPVLRWGAAVACVVVVGAAVSLHKWETHSERALPARSAPASDVPPALSGTTAARLESHASAAIAKPVAAVPSPLAKPAPAEFKAAPMARLQPRAAVPQAEPSQHSDEKTSDLVAGNEIDSLVPGRAKDAAEEANAPSGDTAEVTGMAVPMPTAPMTANSALRPKSRVAPRWTLTSDGTLQRSVDLGRTWEPITVADGVSLRALAANGLDIWVGGTAGALYHSADAGQHWTRVQPASDSLPLAADIIGVEFPDLQNGRLTTSSGEVWTTKDAGLNWEKQ